MSLKISFILPCYNVERYIADCLESIYAQDMPENEFEVICVDDCSTDNTCKVIEGRQSSHSNLKLIRHSKNSHVGIARNTGINNAVGEYVCFVDADDMLPKDVMKRFYSVAFENDLEVLLYNFMVVSDGACIDDKIRFPDSDVVSGGEYVEHCLLGDIGQLGIVWAKLFKRSFLLHHSIGFSDLVYSEDAAYSWEAMICAKRVKSTAEIGYVYRVNDTSFSTNKKKPYVTYTCSVLYPVVLMAMLDRYGDRVPAVIRKGINNEIETVVNGFFVEYLDYSDDERRELYSMIQKHKPMVGHLGRYLHRRQKIAYASRKFGYGIFNNVVRNLFKRCSEARV